MNQRKKRTLYRFLSLSIIFIGICYLMPMFRHITDFDLHLILENMEGRNDAWIRSLIFASVSSLFNVFFGLFIAIQFRNITFFSKRGVLLSILMIPVLLGDVSVAFIGKVILADISLMHTNPICKFISLILIQFWQYGTLYIYIYWIIIQGIPLSKRDFAKTSKFTNFEYVKDVVLPSCKNLALSMFVLNFIFAFFENSKSQLIFKASRGTNSEFISKWLDRTYQSTSLFNLDLAISNTIHVSVFVVISSLISIILLTTLIDLCYKLLIKQRFTLPSISTKFTEKPLYISLVSLVVLPILFIVWELLLKSNFASPRLLFSFVLSFTAALIATFISIQIGIFLRLGWKNAMGSFNNKSLAFFLSMLFVLLLPPICLFITGFEWLNIIGYTDITLICIVWVMAHIILILPILSCFVAVTHYRTTLNELEFVESYKLQYNEISKTLFYKKYRLDYLLTFLIALSFIWNESTINNILSDFIPSFISEMKMSISGRGTDYSSGISYFLISISIALTSIILWNKAMVKLNK